MINKRRDIPAEHNASGSSGCSHEWWHKFNASAANVQLRAHVHLMHNELVYLLKGLDNPDFADENGRSILENALVTVSTESGDGRHSDPVRELSGIFHAISSCNERFKTGGFIDVDSEGIDVYNTMLGALGVTSRVGPANRTHVDVPALLV